jgi:hypothetical protein
MATYLQAINRVLTDIREGDNLVDASATTITDAYHLFVASVVNTMLEEVESAHEWMALRQSGTETYTASAQSEPIDVITVTDQARIISAASQHAGDYQPLVFDVTDSNSPYRLTELPLRELIRRQELATSDSDLPAFFAIEPDGSGGLNLRLYPVPDNARSITLHMVVPQARLDPTASADLSTTIKVPVSPVIQGAVWYCLAERGEELGTSLDLQRQRYLTSVTDEIAREMTQTGDERFDLILV